MAVGIQSHNEAELVAQHTNKSECHYSKCYQCQITILMSKPHEKEISPPEARFDLTAAVHVTFVFHGQRQVPQVIQADAGII